jgi:hypothetical protein
MALKAYRQRAEEILDGHFVAMENFQNNYDHEVTSLKAENQKLREALGRGEKDPSLLQTVLFQTMAPTEDESAKKKDAKNKMKQGGSDDDDADKRPARKNKKGKDEPENPGGTWQQFMAWVPNGSGLMNPEPWKPLPDAAGMLPGGAAGLRSQKSMHPGAGGAAGAAGGNGQFWGALPGQVQDEKAKKKKDVNDDDESGSDEDENEEPKLDLLEVWKPTDKEKKRKTHGISGELESRCDSVEDDHIEPVPKSRFIINPDSNIRICWDLGSLFMVVYDMIMIPMAVFSMPEHGFLTLMDWCTRLFWTLDMGWSCLTGVVLADGSVEYNFRVILKRYFKSWFGLDFFIVGSDWSGVILSSGGMGLSRLARISRIARVVRLLRLVRMQEVIAGITERIQSDSMILMLQVFKLFTFLIACCHATACGWFGVGVLSGAGSSWIAKYGYSNEDVGLQYLVSLHWSLSQFSGGLEEFGPTSASERFYTVLIWVVSFISGLVMLSFLTSSLTQQYIIGGSGARQMATLKKYLNQNKIPKNLIKRLCRSAKHAISGDLQPDSVDLLHVVSEPLRIEMHYEMYSRVVNVHPFFQDFLFQGNQTMRRICHTCMSMLLLDAGDVLFMRFEEPADPRMYFVFSGMFEYEDKYLEKHQVGEKMWCSEPVLWAAWRHQGTLQASCDAKMVVIEAEQFQDVCASYMKKQRGEGFNPKVYAAAYIKELNEMTEWSDLLEV